MAYDFNDPNYLFNRAEEVRAHADLMRDTTNKEILLRIAADYERLGERGHLLLKRGGLRSRMK